MPALSPGTCYSMAQQRNSKGFFFCKHLYSNTVMGEVSKSQRVFSKVTIGL